MKNHRKTMKSSLKKLKLFLFLDLFAITLCFLNFLIGFLQLWLYKDEAFLNQHNFKKRFGLFVFPGFLMIIEKGLIYSLNHSENAE